MAHHDEFEYQYGGKRFPASYSLELVCIVPAAEGIPH